MLFLHIQKINRTFFLYLETSEYVVGYILLLVFF